MRFILTSYVQSQDNRFNCEQFSCYYKTLLEIFTAVINTLIMYYFARMWKLKQNKLGNVRPINIL